MNALDPATLRAASLFCGLMKPAIKQMEVWQLELIAGLALGEISVRTGQTISDVARVYADVTPETLAETRALLGEHVPGWKTNEGACDVFFNPPA